MSDLFIEYDPWRGGCCLHFGRQNRGLGPLVPTRTVWNDSRSKLRNLGTEAPISGSFAVSAERSQAGPLEVRQNSKELQVWFSHVDSPPLSQWHREDHERTVLYLSREGDVSFIEGIVFVWPQGPISLYPVQQLHLAVEDFK